ncbi:hypothetical protein PIB30_065735 [Stylosanthes scabra]|uniref:Secreted protein n=1 Tax=Stylosanthes scabra TaxID=79078 RepID=A0ABU6SM76_9FABA|nr:hypothetical protein [Stylosanthes scabra]
MLLNIVIVIVIILFLAALPHSHSPLSDFTLTRSELSLTLLHDLNPPSQSIHSLHTTTTYFPPTTLQGSSFVGTLLAGNNRRFPFCPWKIGFPSKSFTHSARRSARRLLRSDRRCRRVIVAFLV